MCAHCMWICTSLEDAANKRAWNKTGYSCSCMRYSVRKWGFQDSKLSDEDSLESRDFHRTKMATVAHIMYSIRKWGSTKYLFPTWWCGEQVFGKSKYQWINECLIWPDAVATKIISCPWQKLNKHSSVIQATVSLSYHLHYPGNRQFDKQTIKRIKIKY
jgi:hypothetical protein